MNISQYNIKESTRVIVGSCLNGCAYVLQARLKHVYNAIQEQQLNMEEHTNNLTDSKTGKVYKNHFLPYIMLKYDIDNKEVVRCFQELLFFCTKHCSVEFLKNQFDIGFRLMSKKNTSDNNSNEKCLKKMIQLNGFLVDIINKKFKPSSSDEEKNTQLVLNTILKNCFTGDVAQLILNLSDYLVLHYRFKEGHFKLHFLNETTGKCKITDLVYHILRNFDIHDNDVVDCVIATLLLFKKYGYIHLGVFLYQCPVEMLMCRARRCICSTRTCDACKNRMRIRFIKKFILPVLYRFDPSSDFHQFFQLRHYTFKKVLKKIPSFD